MKDNGPFLETADFDDSGAGFPDDAVRSGQQDNVRLSGEFPVNPSEMVGSDQLGRPLGRFRTLARKSPGAIPRFRHESGKRRSDFPASDNCVRWFHMPSNPVPVPDKNVEISDLEQSPKFITRPASNLCSCPPCL